MQIRAKQKDKDMEHSLSRLKTEFEISQQYPIKVTLPNGEVIKGLAKYEDHIFGHNLPGFGSITMDKPLEFTIVDEQGEDSTYDDDAVIEFIWLALTEGDSSEHTFHCGVHYKLLVD